MAAQIGSNDVHHRFARGAAQRKRTDCSRSARSNTKPAARMANEQRIENANFTGSFNVSMALISLSAKFNGYRSDLYGDALWG